MALKELVPWRWDGLRRWDDDDRRVHIFRSEIASLHREMNRLLDECWQEANRPTSL